MCVERVLCCKHVDGMLCVCCLRLVCVCSVECSAVWVCVSCVVVSGPDRGSRSSEGQAEQHEQGDGLGGRGHVGEAEVGLVAAVAPLGGLELQQVQGQHGARRHGELPAHRGSMETLPWWLVAR